MRDDPAVSLAKAGPARTMTTARTMDILSTIPGEKLERIWEIRQSVDVAHEEKPEPRQASVFLEHGNLRLKSDRIAREMAPDLHLII
jgi:hypothetical protein